MKILIVGAGFGGLRLARKLNNREGVEVLLLDRFNYHQFQPLFYQVATAGLDASNISFPLRKIFQRSRNVRIRLAEIRGIRPDTKTVITDSEEIPYDILVLATGAGSQFFGNEEIARHAFPMKSTVEALQLRYRILQNLETALSIKEESEREALMNILVAGGGPTGVEIAGALAEMRRYVLPKEYPELDFSRMRVILAEGGAATLATMSPKSSARSQRYLRKLGVELMTNTLVKTYDGKEAKLSNGDTISTGTLIWAAGIKGNVPDGVDKSLIARGDRILVNEYSQVEGHPDIFAIGDLALMKSTGYPEGHPQVAPVAIQQASLLAANLRLLVKQGNRNKWKRFRYKDKGSMATVGRNLAVVDIPRPKMRLGGFPAWLIWMSLHLMLILGVKNRFFVFVNWLYNYITYDQNLRLIFREFDRDRGK